MSKILIKLAWYTFLSVFAPTNKILHKRTKYRNKLTDATNKRKALLDTCKDLDIKVHKIRMIRGGWNFDFIINDRYVFKIKDGDKFDIKNIVKEKRITDAFANIVPLQIPKIEIIHAGQYVFWKYEFINGKNLTKLSLKTIIKNRETWSKQIAEFIFAMHNSLPREINDLKDGQGDSWGHNDICNNIIVDTKSMKIVGIIDWEYAGWNFLETEFKNCTYFSKKLRIAGFDTLIRKEYKNLLKKHK